MKRKPFSNSKALTGALLLIFTMLLRAQAATFTVTNTSDSGPGSLRQAIVDANTNAQADTINFDPQVFSTAQTITLGSEIRFLPDGANPGSLITIDGPGANLLVISGGNAVRPFSLAPNSSLAMSGITLSDGNGVGTVINSEGRSGGAILVHEASLTLTNMVIRNNTVANTGGGIYMDSSKTLVISDCLFTENKANDVGAISSRGSSVKSVTDTIISNNQATNDTGGAGFRDGTITIANVQITGNKAGAPTAAGGGGEIGGLGLYQVSGSVTDTVVSNNSVGGGKAIGSIGGMSADGGAMTLRRVTVTGNTAFDTAGGSGSAGGMYLRAPSQKMTLVDSLVANNAVLAGEGGGGHAGGITIATGSVDIINTTIANNSVPNGIGGGIANFATGLTVINSTITGNSATGRRSDGYFGGGIVNFFSNVAHVQNSIVANNTGPSGMPAAPDVSGTFASGGYNIIGNTSNSTGFGATGDQLNIDPLLDSNGLQNNGGATLTIALQPNSPAIDKGKTVDGVAADQRGVARPTDDPAVANAESGDGSDIGAFEVGEANGVAEKTLGNIATRLTVAPGDSALIGGIIVVGNVPKQVIIRALGPSLSAVGISGALENPTLQLFDGDTLVAANNDWRDDQESEIAATGIAPSDDREAAIVRTLQPGSYTAVLRGEGDSSGVALVEAYDLDQRPDSKLANISTRGLVGTGEGVLIGGFIVGPTTEVVVRGIGPSLGNAGVKGALQDPLLELVDTNGEVVRANDNWKSTQRAELEASGIQPSDDREAAMIATLTAGSYTAVLRGNNNGTGIGLVEVYNVQ